MRNVIKCLFLALLTGFVSCSEDDQEGQYKVKYVIAGNGVEEIKYNINNTNYSVKKNFANGWDTTFTHTTKQHLQLQAKADGNTSGSLTGIIILDGVEVAKQVDNTKDASGKVDVKVEHHMQ